MDNALYELIRKELAKLGATCDARWAKWPELVKAVERIVIEDRKRRT